MYVGTITEKQIQEAVDQLGLDRERPINIINTSDVALTSEGKVDLDKVIGGKLHDALLAYYNSGCAGNIPDKDSGL